MCSRAGAALAEHRLFLGAFVAFEALAPRVVAPAAPQAVPDLRSSSLVCAGVSFAYPGSAILRGVDLKLRPGEHVALVGRNGCGKSTLVRLLARLHDPDQKGVIRCGGVDLRRSTPTPGVRSRAVPEHCTRAPATARRAERRSRGRRRRPRASVELAGVAERIDRLPRGLDTMLVERFEAGSELSAGEWRRLLLARVLHRRAPLCVLDEAARAWIPLRRGPWPARRRCAA